LRQSFSCQVSVVVVNFNRVNLLREALASLAAQVGLGAGQWEVIVVDNGSRDGSAEMVARDFPEVRLLRNTDNKGFCEANNQGIAWAQGEFIALLNNDAVASPGWLAALRAGMDAAPRVGMVASKILVRNNPQVIDKVGHLIYWDGQNRGRASGARDVGQFEQAEEVLWPDGCAALYRKAMLDEIGGFDEDFFAYADDADLGLRGRLAGWRAWYSPQAVVWHERGATLGKLNPRRIELIERNRIWLVWKHFPFWLVLLNPFYFLIRLLSGVVAGAAGQGEAGRFQGFRAKIELGVALLRANWQAWQGFGVMWRKRQALRRSRRLNDAELVALLRRYQITLAELNGQAA
jgi:GT2 family glycosyltransferase